jgi:hypothetical protein
MTALEQVLNKKTLERIDRYRREHGIRTRKAAIEEIVINAVPLEKIEMRKDSEAQKGKS